MWASNSPLVEKHQEHAGCTDGSRSKTPLGFIPTKLSLLPLTAHPSPTRCREGRGSWSCLCSLNSSSICSIRLSLPGTRGGGHPF